MALLHVVKGAHTSVMPSLRTIEVSLQKEPHQNKDLLHLV